MENAVEDSSVLCLSTPTAKLITSEMHLPQFRIHKDMSMHVLRSSPAYILKQYRYNSSKLGGVKVNKNAYTRYLKSPD